MITVMGMVKIVTGGHFHIMYITKIILCMATEVYVV